MKRTVYLPIEEPPEGWRPFEHIHGYVNNTPVAYRVLGPPVPALPDALSPEARAWLDAGAEWGAIATAERPVPRMSTSELYARAKAYAATLTPPDPLREAREALIEARANCAAGHPAAVGDALTRLSAALSRLAEQGGAA